VQTYAHYYDGYFGRKLTLKVYFKAQLNEQRLREVEEEITIHKQLQKVRHDYIIGFYHKIEDEHKIVLVLEPATGFASHLGLVPEATLMVFFFHLLQALSRIHSCRFIHRALCVENFFLVDGKLKIGNFSHACVFQDPQDANTPRPQSHLHLEDDIRDMGKAAYRLLTGSSEISLPFPGLSPHCMSWIESTTKRRTCDDSLRHPFFTHVSIPRIVYHEESEPDSTPRIKCQSKPKIRTPALTMLQSSVESEFTQVSSSHVSTTPSPFMMKHFDKDKWRPGGGGPPLAGSYDDLLNTFPHKEDGVRKNNHTRASVSTHAVSTTAGGRTTAVSSVVSSIPPATSHAPSTSLSSPCPTPPSTPVRSRVEGPVPSTSRPSTPGGCDLYAHSGVMGSVLPPSPFEGGGQEATSVTSKPDHSAPKMSRGSSLTPGTISRYSTTQRTVGRQSHRQGLGSVGGAMGMQDGYTPSASSTAVPANNINNNMRCNNINNNMRCNPGNNLNNNPTNNINNSNTSMITTNNITTTTTTTTNNNSGVYLTHHDHGAPHKNEYYDDNTRFLHSLGPQIQDDPGTTALHHNPPENTRPSNECNGPTQERPPLMPRMPKSIAPSSGEAGFTHTGGGWGGGYRQGSILLPKTEIPHQRFSSSSSSTTTPISGFRQCSKRRGGEDDGITEEESADDVSGHDTPDFSGKSKNLLNRVPPYTRLPSQTHHTRPPPLGCVRALVHDSFDSLQFSSLISESADDESSLYSEAQTAGVQPVVRHQQQYKHQQQDQQEYKHLHHQQPQRQYQQEHQHQQQQHEREQEHQHQQQQHERKHQHQQQQHEREHQHQQQQHEREHQCEHEHQSVDESSLYSAGSTVLIQQPGTTTTEFLEAQIFPHKNTVGMENHARRRHEHGVNTITKLTNSYAARTQADPSHERRDKSSLPQAKQYNDDDDDDDDDEYARKYNDVGVGTLPCIAHASTNHGDVGLKRHRKKRDPGVRASRPISSSRREDDPEARAPEAAAHALREATFGHGVRSPEKGRGHLPGQCEERQAEARGLGYQHPYEQQHQHQQHGQHQRSQGDDENGKCNNQKRAHDHQRDSRLHHKKPHTPTRTPTPPQTATWASLNHPWSDGSVSFQLSDSMLQNSSLAPSIAYDVTNHHHLHRHHAHVPLAEMSPICSDGSEADNDDDNEDIAEEEGMSHDSHERRGVDMEVRNNVDYDVDNQDSLSLTRCVLEDEEEARWQCPEPSSIFEREENFDEGYTQFGRATLLTDHCSSRPNTEEGWGNNNYTHGESMIKEEEGEPSSNNHNLSGLVDQSRDISYLRENDNVFTRSEMRGGREMWEAETGGEGGGGGRKAEDEASNPLRISISENSAQISTVPRPGHAPDARPWKHFRGPIDVKRLQPVRIAITDDLALTVTDEKRLKIEHLDHGTLVVDPGGVLCEMVDSGEQYDYKNLIDPWDDLYAYTREVINTLRAHTPTVILKTRDVHCRLMDFPIYPESEFRVSFTRDSGLISEVVILYKVVMLRSRSLAELRLPLMMKEFTNVLEEVGNEFGGRAVIMSIIEQVKGHYARCLDALRSVDSRINDALRSARTSSAPGDTWHIYQAYTNSFPNSQWPIIIDDT